MEENKEAWEEISPSLFRMWVPGGWLVQVYAETLVCEKIVDDQSDGGKIMNVSVTNSLCFFPDVEHRWKIKDSIKFCKEQEV